MTAGTVTVEFVMWNRRVGPLKDCAYVVVQTDSDGNEWHHLPDTDTERSLPVVKYGRKVCAELGALWVEPAPWIPGAVDTFDDVTRDSNGLVRGRLQCRPGRRVAA